MKGITHFISGVAVASCFPEAVGSVFTAKGFLLPLGGAFGVMPDTLDFRLARYIWNYQHVVRINENDLNPRIPAEAVAAAIDEAAETGKSVTLRMDIIRLSSSYYRTYLVFVDEKKKEVTCLIGPLKTMGQVMEKLEHMPDVELVRESIEKHGVAATFQNIYKITPCLPETAPEKAFYTAKFKADVINTYYSETEVGIFSGPDFEFVPRDGKVRMDFIPWHRRWSHSLTVGALMGPIGFALLADWSALFSGNFSGFFTPGSIAAFFIAMLAFWTHILEDQTGFLGSNLFYPFTKDRSVGMKWTTAASPMSNIYTGWLAIAIIVWNLNSLSPEPAFTMHWAQNISGGFSSWNYYLVSLLNYIAYVLVIPYFIFQLILGSFPGAVKRRKRSNVEMMEIEGYAGEQMDSADS
ncbi:MAG: metal-dependent hydrolase [Candidatus Wallbacteria bacterium]|nr:metal-dependent hydrolase [Candidatus Wallbacteria bacterium]